MLIRNCSVRFGVGMTIGSVWPDPQVNCIRNVTFESIHFEYPIKALYIKSNPGTVGTGLIDSITYRDITANNALWYPIWIGPQQGCFRWLCCVSPARCPHPARPFLDSDEFL